MRTLSRVVVLGAAVTAFACGSRPKSFDREVSLPIDTVGLAGAVAIVDSSVDRVVMVTAGANHEIETSTFDVGKNVVATETSPDRERLFVLSSGVQPRKKPSDELPSLVVLGGTTTPVSLERIELSDPLSRLEVDPEGEWVVVWDSEGVVENPNELILIRLDQTGFEPVTKTIRSFGGRPQRLTFTSTLTLPNGPDRRFLVVETEQDVHLVDLEFLDRPPVTIILPQTATGRTAVPAEIAYHDGDPTDPDDARIAIRLENDSNVVLLELAPPSEDGKDFKVAVNEADLQGVATSIDFVDTDGGLRLAALVPAEKAAALVDPTTIVTDFVSLPGSYSKIARITDDVAEKPDSGDVALLWAGTSNDGIAFWSLGKTAGKPFRSVEQNDIGIVVAEVRDVPGEAFGHRKLLVNESSSEFYVLDLNDRTAFPMLTEATGFDVVVSPDGRRAWALRTGTRRFASVDLDSLHPRSLEVERQVSAVYDVERTDGGRAAIALHSSGAIGCTVLDALEPDTADTKFHTGLLLGGLR